MSTHLVRFVTDMVRLRPALWVQTLLIFGSVLMVLVMMSRSGGLTALNALDQAQVARHLARGEGLTTSFVRPLSLGMKNQIAPHPDLYQAPLPPLVLSLFFRLLGPSDEAVKLAGGLLWACSVWLTFWVARRWFGLVVAGLAALLYVSCAASLSLAMEGLQQPLLATVLLVGMLAVFPDMEDGESHDPFLDSRYRAEGSGWALLLAGFMGALATLTHHLMGPAVLLVGVYLATVYGQQRARTLALYLLGFALPLGFWVLRQSASVGFFFLGLYGYELQADTVAYPGSTIWSRVGEPSALYLLMRHPLEVARKLIPNALAFLQSLRAAFHPVLILLFLAACISQQGASRQGELRLVVATGLLLVGVISCLFRLEAALWSAWTPLLAILASAFLVGWVGERLGPFGAEGAEAVIGETSGEDGSSANREVAASSSGGGRLLVYGVVAALSLLALLLGLATPQAPGDLDLASLVEPAGRIPASAGAIMTDQPLPIAWYADRTAVLLPQRSEDWDKLEVAGLRVAATYLTDAINRLPPPERPAWWFWLASREGIYRRLRPALPSSPRAIMRVRLADEDPDYLASEARIQWVQAVADLQPTAAQARARLGMAYLWEDRLAEAADQFMLALQFEESHPSGYVGLAVLAVRLGDLSAALRLLNQVEGGGTEWGQPQDRVLSVLRRGRQAATAIRTFKSVLTDRLGDPDLFASLPPSEIERRTIAEARRLVGAEPAQVAPRLVLAFVLLWHRQLGPAIAELEAVAARHPASVAVVEALVAVGDACRGLQAWASAERCYRRALTLVPGMLRARLGQAQILRDQGRQDEALALYEKLLLQLPGEAVLLNDLAYLYAERGENLPRARTMAERLVRASPGNAFARDTLGWVLLRSGLAREALDQFRQATALAPSSARLRYHLAKALARVGLAEEATVAFYQALRLGLRGPDRKDAEAYLRALEE